MQLYVWHKLSTNQWVTENKEINGVHILCPIIFPPFRDESPPSASKYRKMCWTRCLFYQGIARTQSPTNKNYALELPTFGVIVEVSPTEVQWKGLALEELPSWSQLTSVPGKYAWWLKLDATQVFHTYSCLWKISSITWIWSLCLFLVLKMPTWYEWIFITHLM